jgi:hypothetical protein
MKPNRGIEYLKQNGFASDLLGRLRKPLKWCRVFVARAVVAELNDDPASLATLFQNTELGRVLRIFMFLVPQTLIEYALLQFQGTAFSW